MGNRLLGLIVLFFALAFAAPDFRPAEAHAPGGTIDVQTFGFATGTGITGAVTATYRNVNDGTKFAVQCQATSNATVAYSLRFETTLDGSNWCNEPTFSISTSVLDNTWHHVAFTPPVCRQFRVILTDLGTTQGVTPSIIIGSI